MTIIPEFVYCFGIYPYNDTKNRRVKFGWSGRDTSGSGSNTLRERQKELIRFHSQQVESTDCVEFLCAVKGNKDDEDLVLGHFQKYWIKNKQGVVPSKEYFHASVEVLDYVRWLRDQCFTSRTMEDADQLIIRTYNEWGPSAEHSKSKASKNLWEDLPDTWLEELGLPLFSSEAYYTYPTLVESSRRVMGGIDLDPMSDHIANARHRIPLIYTNTDNTFARDWKGKIWLNPPFAEWAAVREKFIEELINGNIEQACVYMGQNAWNSQHMSPMKSHCSAMVLSHGRWPHWGDLSEYGSPFSEGILYFGPNVDAFKHEFSQYGHVFVLAADYRGPYSPNWQDQETIAQASGFTMNGSKSKGLNKKENGKKHQAAAHNMREKIEATKKDEQPVVTALDFFTSLK